MTVRVQVDHTAIRALTRSEAVRADLRRRAEHVTLSAASRARQIGPGTAAHWADAMDHEAGTDELGPYEDVSWRIGKYTEHGSSFGHLLLLGTSEPNHPAHLDVLLGALDEV